MTVAATTTTSGTHVCRLVNVMIVQTITRFTIKTFQQFRLLFVISQRFIHLIDLWCYLPSSHSFYRLFWAQSRIVGCAVCFVHFAFWFCSSMITWRRRTSSFFSSLLFFSRIFSFSFVSICCSVIRLPRAWNTIFRSSEHTHTHPWNFIHFVRCAQTRKLKISSRRIFVLVVTVCGSGHQNLFIFCCWFYFFFCFCFPKFIFGASLHGHAHTKLHGQKSTHQKTRFRRGGTSSQIETSENWGNGFASLNMTSFSPWKSFAFRLCLFTIRFIASHFFYGHHKMQLLSFSPIFSDLFVLFYLFFSFHFCFVFISMYFFGDKKDESP